ncbi:OTU-domain-containing protein [Conidiobolus coronatus NRRL 28638]|uniref:Ubiquitin thioesterase OTU n=1 Tax=Conidiobolus coronatus (strain ATCC 28846 / CBS 209.66 / NRRL 28638) TaxID=796925 RepID=A0A137NYT3_CONC2|nr:OTU-domain-containing protein [Conidiobolus coronatus NRRL 28638]|eukprot:KXN67990.1 OTU-domain-containing protein [Conidiobolus coronatus NRRL 28638]
MSLKFKITSEAGTHEIQLNKPGPSWEDLLNVISDKLGVSPNMLQVKAGFPPKLLSASDSTLLSELDIRNNDRLHIIIASNSNNNTSSVSTASNSSNTKPAVETSKYIRINSGYVIRRDIPDDNSCLFRALGVVDKILQDPENYNEAILGRPVKEYCDLILKENTWGGAIELKALSDVYQTEICSIDIQTLRADRFGEGLYPQKVYVLYSGIHYDAVALSPDISFISNQEIDLTIFNKNDTEIHEGVLKLGQVYQKDRAFTDMANFTLKCEVCKLGLKGQKEAQLHAMNSGHSSFSEY